jgi:hypothetical protein
MPTVPMSEELLKRFESLLARAESLLPTTATEPDWQARAYRWRRQGHRAWLQPVRLISSLRLDDLLCIDDQKRTVDANTRQFLAGLPANNVLLWGPRGTGKSSLVKALLNQHADDGLRLIEIEREHLTDLPDIVDLIAARPERYLLFCDDLSFEANDPSYKALKVVLDGSVHATPENVLVYATSNRRHLLPEQLSENQAARNIDGEIHHGEAVEEKISLSERFGLWVALHPFSQDEYLAIVARWLNKLGVAGEPGEDARRAALQWALLHGSRSGRSAWQFAKDWAGKVQMKRGTHG